LCITNTNVRLLDRVLPRGIQLDHTVRTMKLHARTGHGQVDVHIDDVYVRTVRGRKLAPDLSTWLSLAGFVVTGGSSACGGESAVYFSFHSSMAMCCCRHSRLQNAVSPLMEEEEEPINFNL
jgi:hypothetical protein